jgi:peptidoglycan/LPS O-acetylase OafA/YrhL
MKFALLSPQTGHTGTGKAKLPYIDCLRGYAVLMVIATHVTYTVPQLPYPVHQVTSFGWFGVQLFFLASCVTLMMSSSYERSKSGTMNVRNFFIRRFLRIAPMYYLAGIFYWYAGTRTGANWAQTLSALTFTNSWGPATMPTGDGWQLVPGGWSIGVEFTFYFLFPLYFWYATSWRRALAVFLGALIVGAVADSAVVGQLAAVYGFTATDNFLFFWFFNQASVFALGGLVFFAVSGIARHKLLAAKLKRLVAPVVVASLAVLALLAFGSSHFAHYLALRPVVPHFLPVILAFSVAIIALSQADSGLFINRAIASLGKVSFSAYLLHFAVFDWVVSKNPGLFHLDATGVPAIAAFGAAYAVVIAVTYLLSACSYSLIELPMMDLAKRLTRPKPIRATALQSASP